MNHERDGDREQMEDITIRAADPNDAGAIAEIYNHYIANSTATFDEIPKTAEERIAWLDAHDAAHPVIVAERGGQVIGWGSLTKFRERAAWRHTVEVGIYLADAARGAGLGPLLLEELVEAARVAGHRAIIAMIVADNEPSIKLVARGGFEQVGLMREVGYKFGTWLDLVIMELLLPMPEGTS